MPKDNGRETQLIFHLSHDFPDGKSINSYTAHDKCTVKYHDLDEAVKCCLEHLEQTNGETNLWFGKVDGRSAFRVLPLLKKCWKWLLMTAQNPENGEVQYFIDKCLPFGHSISCALFQAVSNALKHIFVHRTSWKVPRQHVVNNHLNDFLFIARMYLMCNWLVQQFILMCSQIGFPLVEAKNQVGYTIDCIPWNFA